MRARKPRDDRQAERADPIKGAVELAGRASSVIDLAQLVFLLGLGVPTILLLAFAEGAFVYAGLVLLLVGLLVGGFWLAYKGTDVELTPVTMVVAVPIAGAILYLIFRLLFAAAPR